jgi:hypothetical protein
MTQKTLLKHTRHVPVGHVARVTFVQKQLSLWGAGTGGLRYSVVELVAAKRRLREV